MGDCVTGACLYVCRQIYKTCEGLLVLRPFRLHVQIAAAWKRATRQAAEASTPTLQDDDGESAAGAAAAVPSLTATADMNNASSRRRFSSVSEISDAANDAALWERNLMDNLLNYAATPNGVLLLQSTGAMPDCVAYMVSRYDQKQQVSKFEKFGYGSMVSQLATTCAGMNALASTSFLKTLVVRIWESLECEIDDDSCAIRGPPPAYPVAALDKSLVKPFRILVNVCSSFPALFEHLHDAELPVNRVYNFRDDLPNSVVDLIDRIILVDSPEKIHSLFNYEQSHVFGLKFLAAMISSLDSLLFLQVVKGNGKIAVGSFFFSHLPFLSFPFLSFPSFPSFPSFLSSLLSFLLSLSPLCFLNSFDYYFIPPPLSHSSSSPSSRRVFLSKSLSSALSERM